MARYAFVVLKYKVPLERINQSTEAHRAYLRELNGKGKLVASGPFEPRTGGGLLFRVGDEAELKALLARDPFQMEDLADYSIHFWGVTIGVDGLDAMAKIVA